MTDVSRTEATDDVAADQGKFGAFLVQREKISQAELEAALHKQEDLNIRLGILAMNRDVLTYEQVRTVLQEQEQSGDLFGICAVRLGLLYPGQVDGLLTEQKDQRLKLGELLVIGNVLSPEDLTAALADFGQASE